MATKTADMALSRVIPRGYHRGVDVVRCTISLTATTSAGDVFLWGKVPNGSTLLAIQMGNGGSPDDLWPATYEIDGVTLGSETCMASGFPAGVNLGCPHTVSLSDGETPTFAMLKSIAGTITSASAVGSITTTMWLTRNVGSDGGN